AFDTGAMDPGARPSWSQALAIPGALEHRLGPRVLSLVANYSIAIGGDPEHAYRQAMDSLPLAEDLGVDVDFIQWVSIGATAMRSGHLDDARMAAHRAVELASDDPARRARAYVLLTAIERWSGDRAAAADAAREAELAARAADQPLDIGQALMIRGY